MGSLCSLPKDALKLVTGPLVKRSQGQGQSEQVTRMTSNYYHFGNYYHFVLYAVLLLGILKKGPDPARTFKKRANQNISGPHTHLMQNTLSISICALPFYKKLL